MGDPISKGEANVMPLKAREFDKFVNKFGFEISESHHRRAVLKIDGRPVVTTRRSHKKGDLPSSNAILKQLKLNAVQMQDAIKCNLSPADYFDILRAQQVI